MKPIQFSNHARKRMTGRGATETEIIQTIQSEAWQPALENKKTSKEVFRLRTPLSDQSTSICIQDSSCYFCRGV